ncbi:hypothetical protein LSUE1_G008209 [Lachnellula suecica]|uniref:BTB domain-containing protein n=1 Tax=Lachnellula suecica TaxID=602035 RepID=A0A8T9C3M1_9HELO|nr:hypothetical protein LSUE1_G008209 [Lachnellula suecica]
MPSPPVFAAAFNSEFIEGQTQIYRPEDTDPQVFRLLTQWMYTKSLRYISPGSEAEGQQHLHNLQLAIHLWVLADRFCIPPLQNHAMVDIVSIAYHYQTYPIHSLNFVWENTATGSPLRHYLLDFAALGIDAAGFQASRNESPREMLLELTMNFAQALKQFNVPLVPVVAESYYIAVGAENREPIAAEAEAISISDPETTIGSTEMADFIAPRTESDSRPSHSSGSDERCGDVGAAVRNHGSAIDDDVVRPVQISLASTEAEDQSEHTSSAPIDSIVDPPVAKNSTVGADTLRRLQIMEKYERDLETAGLVLDKLEWKSEARKCTHA